MTFSMLVLSFAALRFAQSVMAGAPVCASTYPLSCHNTTAIENTCCVEVQGQVLQVQFWDTDPATGPADSWTIHGLWPDYCDGSYTEDCDPSRYHYNISCILKDGGTKGTDALTYMKTYWKDDDGDDEEFWEHEWNTHGTCYSTLKPDCFTDYVANEEVVDFFSQAVDLFKTLPTYTWLSDAGITPSSSKTYTKTAIMAALKAPRGVAATLECDDGVLSEVEYTFSVKGSVADGTFVAEAPVGEGTDSCPEEISYPPKDESTVPKVKATTCPALTATEATATPAPGSRKSRRSRRGL